MVQSIKHPYCGLSVYLGSQHKKRRALAPVFESLGMQCVEIEIDTDQYGTFSGEIERKGSVLETLNKKVQEVFSKVPQARLALVSEGTFGPHPSLGLLPSDQESLLLFDKELDLKIYVDEISLETNLGEKNVKSFEEAIPFLERAKFPSHGLIIQPLENQEVLFKGIVELKKLEKAICKSLEHSPTKQAKVMTDMRAHLNPTRMRVIEQVGYKLGKRLNSFCKDCGLLGFWPLKHIEGLPCQECGLPSRAVKEYLWSCLKCSHQEIRPREDGRVYIEPGQCEGCNP